MKLQFVILTMFLFFISCTSCSDENPANDADNVDSDSLSHADTDASDSVIDIDDSSDEVLTESEETPDIDEDVFCPPLKEAGFPYTRNDGTIHFCRECDTPANNDPDCTVNLWKEANEELCVKEPEYDCCGYPCMMDNLRPLYPGEFELIYQDQCDMVLNAENPRGWQTGARFFKHFNMSDGKVGLALSSIGTVKYPNHIKSFEFDIETRKYRVLMQNGNNFTIAYHKGASFQTVTESGLTGVKTRNTVI